MFDKYGCCYESNLLCFLGRVLRFTYFAFNLSDSFHSTLGFGIHHAHSTVTVLNTATITSATVTTTTNTTTAVTTTITAATAFTSATTIIITAIIITSAIANNNHHDSCI